MTLHNRAKRRARYYAAIPSTLVGQTVSNIRGIATVCDMLWLRPVESGLLCAEHPLCTGTQLGTERPIWLDNVVYRTARRESYAGKEPESDDALVTRTGRFMANMVTRAAATDSHARGHQNRMPPGINYLHGGVHYNGAWLIFNDFAEAIAHASDPAFRRDLKRMIELERREPLLLFRERDYDRDEFAELAGCLRTLLPFFANCNGPKRRVLWGNPAPYPVVNIISGNWIRDLRLIVAGKSDEVMRPAIEAGLYFQGDYEGWRDRALWPERMLARLTARRIDARGDRGNLYFVDSRSMKKAS